MGVKAYKLRAVSLFSVSLGISRRKWLFPRRNTLRDLRRSNSGVKKADLQASPEEKRPQPASYPHLAFPLQVEGPGRGRSSKVGPAADQGW